MSDTEGTLLETPPPPKTAPNTPTTPRKPRLVRMIQKRRKIKFRIYHKQGHTCLSPIETEDDDLCTTLLHEKMKRLMLAQMSSHDEADDHVRNLTPIFLKMKRNNSE